MVVNSGWSSRPRAASEPECRLSPESKLTGVVLCGGNSRRMGEDKGLLSSDGLTWFLKIYRLLGELTSATVVSLRQSQIARYRNSLPEGEFIFDDEELQGPLAGIYAVHRSYPHRDLWVVACDLQRLTPEIMERLAEAYREEESAQVLAFSNPQKIVEPLCTIYRAEWLQEFFQGYRRNDEQRTAGARALLKHPSGVILDGDEAVREGLANFNTPDDINQL